MNSLTLETKLLLNTTVIKDGADFKEMYYSCTRRIRIFNVPFLRKKTNRIVTKVRTFPTNSRFTNVTMTS